MKSYGWFEPTIPLLLLHVCGMFTVMSLGCALAYTEQFFPPFAFSDPIVAITVDDSYYHTPTPRAYTCRSCELCVMLICFGINLLATLWEHFSGAMVEIFSWTYKNRFYGNVVVYNFLYYDMIFSKVIFLPDKKVPFSTSATLLKRLQDA